MGNFKLIIAGGRDFTDEFLLARALHHVATTVLSGQTIWVVSGMAKGADFLGWNYARQFQMPYFEFPADWKNLNVPGVKIRTGPRGQYNANAGKDRNQRMAEFADGLLAFWDGKSHGTSHMIKTMEGLGKFVHVVPY